ncbi:FGGY-family carbohydrate kinase, partial [Gaiella sp.]|uniref:FGGY-family carbohydrate kinase n=1 Tax=Gaiella sp. TaxID=2663207 RepID=UPI003267B509
MLGIDVGLSGVKAAVVDDRGELRGSGRCALSPTLGPGRAEIDPDAMMVAVLAAAREALDTAAGVEAIAVAALGPAPILVDDDLDPLTPALLFSLDRRAEPERAELGVTHDHALPKLLHWQRTNPNAVGRAAWALDATGFIVGRLTGVPVMDSITAADYALPENSAPVPSPVPQGPLAIAGGLGAAVARELGLREGTPVIVGTYDSYADIAAAGVIGPGAGCVILGSTLIVGRSVEGPVDCPGLELGGYVGEGLLVGAWTASAGAALDWFETRFGAGGHDVTGLAPGAGGLIALPFLAGERTPHWDPAARGLILGLTLGTERAEVYRAFIDSVALSTLDHVERLRAARLDVPRWRVGGGGTRNEAWLQATCDALATPLEVVAHAGHAIGPAVLALRSIGVESTGEIAREVLPDPRA